jgi:FkbM family methyltransferase
MTEQRFFGQFSPPVDFHIREYFKNEEEGVCIEIGAVDGHYLSNTLHFELSGWDCLCIEPIPQYFEKLKQTRKKCLNYAISSDEKDKVKFNLITIGHNLSSISGLDLDYRLIETHKKLGLNPIIGEIEVQSKRLDWCIENYFNHEKIDFISIDTEGSELDVLKSFDVNKYNIRLLVIENNYNDSDIENYLNNLGWIKDKRIEVNDFYIKK